MTADIGAVGPTPLSYGQERMRLANRMAAGVPSGNVAYAYRLRGRLHVEALERAIAELSNRHQILRTVYPDAGQRVLPSEQHSLSTHDLSGYPDPEAAADRFTATARDEPFALHVELPIRWDLLRLNEDDHLLMLRQHHIATDGWSEGVIQHELSTLYNSYRVDAEPGLPSLSIQYGDYAVQQRREDHTEDLSYWRDRLAEAPSGLTLPCDRRPEADSGYGGRTDRVAMPADLAEAASRLARDLRASEFMVLLAGFALLLSRYGGQTDLVIGTPVAGRADPELEQLIGFFINTVPLRLDASGYQSTRDYVARVREAVLDDLDHAELPFERIVADLNPVREPGRQPLTQVMFQVFNAPNDPPRMDGLTVTRRQLFPSASALDLTVSLVAEPEGLFGYWEYRTDLFDPETIARLQEQYVRLLRSMLAEPDRPIGEAELMSDAERSRLLHDWNYTDKPISATLPDAKHPSPLHGPGDTRTETARTTVVDLFRERVKTSPDQVAVIDGGTWLSNRELDRAANRVAHRLLAAGVGAESLVGIHSERSAELVVAVLGVLKAGAGYLPLDHDLPAERLGQFIADARPDLIVTDAVELSFEIPVLRLNEGHDAPDTDPGIVIDPEQLAYVIFTSGSTGRAKGATITHRGLRNYLLWTLESYRPSRAEGVVPLCSPLSFDFTVTPLFWALLAGKPLLVLPETDTLERIAEALRDTATPIELLKLTPSHLEVLDARLDPDDELTELRQLIVGGEQLHGGKAAAWQRLFPGTRIVNEYGPTENVVGCVTHRFGPEDDPARPVPIGLPIAGTTAYLLDAGLRPVPVGGAGELYLGGSNLCRGYLGRPGLTAQRFLPDPYGSPGARLYRTGDHARRRGDGVIEYLGRKDHQVKLRGHRVELGEIEAALRYHPAVSQAVVTVHDDQRLIGYVVPESGFAATVPELLADLGRRLPSHMIPNTVVELDVLPVTRSGKVDRARLPVPAPEAGTVVIPPRTPVEKAVAAAWRDVLGTAVGLRDNFFEKGGHSLTAATMAGRVAANFGLSSPQLLRDLFVYSTLGGFSGRVQRLVSDETTPAAVIPVQDRSRPFPLPRGQERVWFLDQLDETGGEYEIPLALRITGDLDVTALRASLTGIVERHDVLRTSVTVTDDRPAGVLRPVLDFEFPLIEVPSDSDIDELVREHVLRPLDLAEGLPIRARLIRLRDDDHLLCLKFHHMSFDGWSGHVFYEELAAGYAGDIPTAPRVAFHDLAVWQESSTDAEGLTFWRENLDGLTPFELPGDRPRTARRKGTAHTAAITVAETTAVELERLAGRHSATLFMVLLAACQVLFHRHSGRTDVTIGTTAAERLHPDSERLIGLLVNMIVLRGDVSGDPEFGELIERVRDLARAAYAHQDTPFDLLVEELAPEREAGRTPLFGVMVKLSHQPGLPPSLSGMDVTEVPVPLQLNKYEVTIDFERTADGLRALVIGNSGLYEAETVNRWAEHLSVLLRALSANPQLRASQAPLLSAADEARQRALSGPPATDYPQTSLHQLFESRAAEHPDRTAVVDDHHQLSYGQLDDRANRIAQALVLRGIEVDQPVAVLLNRSVDMLAGILGTLKAGGAFLPIEPDTPCARISTLLSQAGCRIVLCEPELAGTVTEAGGVPITPAEATAYSPLGQPVTVHPDNLCALYFTSGSTGTPKGVACTHNGWVNRMWWMQRRHRLRPGEAVLHKTTLTFDDSAVELFWPLLTGGKVVILPPGLHRDPRAIVDAAVRHRVVHLNFVPSMLDLTLEELTDADLAGLSELRSVLSSGEALRPQLVARFREHFGDRVSLDNTWGATEVSIDSTWHVCGAEDTDDCRHVVSLGRPFDNNDVCVIDASWQQLPVGIVGELCIGGVGLARGYLGDPARTAAAFVPHPYRPGERLYRTGDQGRMRADGSLEFMDRRDNQVKIRGVRIELGEVENILKQHPEVTDAAVTTWQVSPTDKRLAAYIVAGPNSTVSDLRHFAGQQLPSYAVPGYFTIIDALPRLVSGKLDRNSLPQPDPGTNCDVEYREPRTPTEKTVARIWSEVLDIECIGVDDNFFTVGGHSLLATRIITRMRQAFGIHLPLSLIFERSTVGTTAEKIEELVIAMISELSEEEVLRMV